MVEVFLVAFAGLLALVLWPQIRNGLGRALLPGEHSFRRSAWRAAARAAGLVRVEESAGALSGWAGRVHVTLSRYEGGDVHGTRLVLSGPGMALGLAVRPQGLGAALRATLGEREVEVGDEPFDRVAWVEGPHGLAQALLDRHAREAFRSVFGGYLSRPGKMPFLAAASFADGTLCIDVPEVLRPRGQQERYDALLDLIAGNEPPETGCLGRLERLPDVLAAALAFARQLEPPGDVAGRIAANLRDEPEPRVRARSLTVLTREFPGHRATREALLAAREDPDAEVRLRAALGLGDEGRDVLLALAAGEGADDATTARAVAALGARVDPAEARTLLGRALRTRRIATARACMEVLGHQRRAEGVAMLARVLAVEKGELAVAAADALGTAHDPSAEAPLVEVLGSRSSALRHAAARALGRVGTAAAVPPLKAAESRHFDLARAARQAIAEIQARLAGAEPGQLSLAAADGHVGGLTLAAADPAGRLTLAPTSGATREPAAAHEEPVASPERTAAEAAPATAEKEIEAEKASALEPETARGWRGPLPARHRARE